MRAPEHIGFWPPRVPRPPPRRRGRTGARRVYGTDPKRLAQMARRRHVNLASVEGAATGVGGFITLIPDLVGLAWIQSRLVFYVAAAYGFDPHDPMRPAELLVLNGIYDTPSRRVRRWTGWACRWPRRLGRWPNGSATRRSPSSWRSRSARRRRTVRRAADPGLRDHVQLRCQRRDTNALAKRAIKFYGAELIRPARRRR